MSAAETGPLLLYDGTCGFCANTVRFVLRHDRRARTLRFASLQGTIGTAIRDRHPELAGADSVVWLETIDDAAPLVRSAAGLRVLRYLGGGWRALAGFARVLPRGVRDWGYDLVASHRHRLVAGTDRCVIPTEDERGRFLD